MTKTVRITVSGKVQGVYYRMYTQMKARELGIRGYVRNLPNGDVEIVATAEDTKLQQLVDWCHVGSPSAVVTNVLVEDIQTPETFRDFEIRY